MQEEKRVNNVSLKIAVTFVCYEKNNCIFVSVTNFIKTNDSDET